MSKFAQDHNLADRIFNPAIAYSASKYQRGRDLPYVLCLHTHELADFSSVGTMKIIDKLEARAAGMRSLSLRGHYSYDANRHVAVLAAIRGELSWLEKHYA